MKKRHIFFLSNGFKSGNGTLNIEYTGRIYYNAVHLKDFKSMYNPAQDLLIDCTQCAKKKYGKFIKIQTK